jgi:hypothetical protein
VAAARQSAVERPVVIVPDGYLDALRAEIERLADAMGVFLGRASADEVEALHGAFAQPFSPANPEHAVHELVAAWTLKRVSARDDEQTELDIGHLWHEIERLLVGLLDEAVHGGVDPSGTIFGFEKYEVFDVQWIAYLIGWLEHSPSSGKIAELPTGGVVVEIADDTTIAVVGDWGTGVDYPTQSAAHVAAAIRTASPDYSVHLGDVYYAGADQEQHFLDPWGPAAGRFGSFALNSNHDMYDGANGYVHITLQDPRFHLHQQARTHFALHNSSWTVVGLDTAGPASWKHLYMKGDVDDDQLAFLAEQVATGKGLILLTHHQGLDDTTSAPNDPLYSKIVACVEAHRLGDGPWYWYWGHIHAGYVHTDDVAPFRGRCAGHGGIPWGRARGLERSAGIRWHEQTPSTIGSHRVTNGFALLTLHGDRLDERFVDETGAVTYTVPDA